MLFSGEELQNTCFTPAKIKVSQSKNKSMYLIIGGLVLFWVATMVSQNKPQTSPKQSQSNRGKQGGKGLYGSFKKTLNHVKNTGKMPIPKTKKRR